MNYTRNYMNASVVYTENHNEATGRVMPSLSVQVIDDYGFQREFYLRYRHEPGNSKNLYWEWVIYQHPTRRNSGTVSTAVAQKFLERFHTLINDYSSLLFGEGPPNNRGFVQLAETLHANDTLSMRMLP